MDIDKAVAKTSFRVDGVEYTREYFASYPAKAIFVRLRADKPVMRPSLFFTPGLSCVCRAESDALFVRDASDCIQMISN